MAYTGAPIMQTDAAEAAVTSNLPPTYPFLYWLHAGDRRVDRADPDGAGMGGGGTDRSFFLFSRPSREEWGRSMLAGLSKTGTDAAASRT